MHRKVGVKRTWYKRFKIILFCLALMGLIKVTENILLSPGKFQAGQFLATKEWGVSPKKVIGTKTKNQQLFYLLMDQDKYEHLQYISRTTIEHKAYRVPCSH